MPSGMAGAEGFEPSVTDPKTGRADLGGCRVPRLQTADLNSSRTSGVPHLDTSLTTLVPTTCPNVVQRLPHGARRLADTLPQCAGEVACA